MAALEATRPRRTAEEGGRRCAAHAEELALLDAANCGNPVKAMIRDGYDGPDYIDFFAGLATEAKGRRHPDGRGHREPHRAGALRGVRAHRVAANHPYMFAAMKIGAPLVTGNTVIITSRRRRRRCHGVPDVSKRSSTGILPPEF